LIDTEYHRYRHEGPLKFLWLLVFILVAISVLPWAAGAANLTFVSDTVSNSRPGVSADHTVKFTVTNIIPASGKIIITPQAGVFTIPAGLGMNDLDLFDDGVNLTLADAAGSGSGSAIGVSITSGTGGKITFTLNDTDAITVGSVVTVKIGTNATFGVAGSQQIKNPSGVGSYRIAFETQNAFGGVIDQAQAMIAIIIPVQVGGLIKPIASSEFLFTPVTATTTTLLNPDGTKLTVNWPIGFATSSDDFRLEISSFQKQDFTPASSPPSGKSVVGKVYDINLSRVVDGSQVGNFPQDITFDFFYLDSEIYGIDENTLKPYYWNDSSWTAINGSTVFSNENRVRVSVNHLSNFTLMGNSSSAPAPPPSGSGGSGGGGGGISLPVVTSTSTPATAFKRGDINRDGKVNIVDFSIAAYWYKRLNPPTSVDINGDGAITLVDFSIMAFYWTR